MNSRKLSQTLEEKTEFWYYANETHYLNIVVHTHKSDITSISITGTAYEFNTLKSLKMDGPRIFTEKNLSRSTFISKEELVREFEEICKKWECYAL